MIARCDQGHQMAAAGGRACRGRTVEARWRCFRCRVIVVIVTARGVRVERWEPGRG